MDFFFAGSFAGFFFNKVKAQNCSDDANGNIDDKYQRPGCVVNNKTTYGRA